MSVSFAPQIPLKNRLLTAIPSEEYSRLKPKLEAVSLPFKQVIYEPGDPIEYVYFPNSGVVSLLTVMEDGTAEVALVGNEGMVGLPIFLEVDTMPIKAIVQGPGDAMRIKADIFKDVVTQHHRLRSLLQHYTHALMFQISQAVACNHYHSVKERYCRWLLMTHDRMQSDQFPLTQEFLSQMLGVRRASITMVANRLQQAGLIRYSRGQITILDRLGLESACCKCYELVKEEFDHLLGSQ